MAQKRSVKKNAKKEVQEETKVEIKSEKQTTDVTKSEVREKTKPEKILTIVGWVLFCLLGIFPFIPLGVYLVLDGYYDELPDLVVVLLDRVIEFLQNSRRLVFLPLLAVIILSAFFAFISKRKKNPRIRSRYWVKTAVMMFLSLVLFALCEMVLDYVTETQAGKPIIYLYPTEETEVSVKVGKPENLTHTYPKYEDGWRVMAQPNGDLKDVKGRSYYALYWEGIQPSKMGLTEGFIVKGSDTIAFLEEKLALLGLTEREAEEFIVYWLPRLEVNEYNLIRFETKVEIDENMPLYITPKPDTVIRVMMDHHPAKGTEKVEPQQLPPPPKREGFVVVEWGGTQ